MASGLALDPNSVTGHLLAAYLHVAQRTIEPAKREFRWVLGRDAAHPRALLGLARIALEEGDLVGCRECLSSALRAYPDFPEARAVLDAIAAPDASATPPAAPPRLERLRLPGAARALVVVDAQGRALVERPAVEDGGPRLARVARLAGAALAAPGFGPLRRAIIDDREQTDFIRADSVLTLALALPRTTPIPQGFLEVNRLWGAVQHELAVTRDESLSHRPTASGECHEQIEAGARSRRNVARPSGPRHRGGPRAPALGARCAGRLAGRLRHRRRGSARAGRRAAGRAGGHARARSRSGGQPARPRRVSDGAVLGRRRHGASWPRAASDSSWRWPSRKRICSQFVPRSARQ